ADRGDRPGGPVCGVCERRHEKSVTDRAARGHRDHPPAGGVSDAHAPVDAAGIAEYGPYCGRRVGRCLVPADLSHRAEDRVRMAQVAAFLALAMAAGVMPLGGQTSLSIYSDGRVVVRRTLPQALPKGRSTLSLKLEGLDPATLFSPDTSVTLLSALLRPATDRQAALQRAVGQTLAFVRQREGGGADTVRASVVRTDPAQYRLPDGRLFLDDPGEPLFPPELVRTAPEVTLVLEGARDRPRTELAYVTEGTTWEALYQVVVGGGGSGSVTGTATLRSQALRADSADVHIVAATERGAAPAQHYRVHPGVRRPRRPAVARVRRPDARRRQSRACAGVVHPQAWSRHALRRPAPARGDGPAVSGRLGRPTPARGGGAERA